MIALYGFIPELAVFLYLTSDTCYDHNFYKAGHSQGFYARQ